MSDDSFSIVIPCHNEEDVLRDNVEKVIDEIKDFKQEWELLIVEDGCTDETPEIADELSERYGEVRHLHFKEKLGKGKAITEAFNQSKCSKLVFMDADLATDLKHIPEILEELESNDIVIGSRYKVGASSNRNLEREFLSRAYNIAARIFFQTGVKDHQCGFKGFRKKAFDEIKNDIESNHWFWDTELVINAQEKGIDVKEKPIEWEEKRDSGVKISQTIMHFSTKLFEQKIG